MTLNPGKHLAIIWIGATAGNAMPARPLSVCIDERPWIPFTNPDLEHPGEMQKLISASALELDLNVQLSSLPWKRCQETTRQGKMDAIVGAAFVPFNQALAEFPMNGGEVDSKRSLGTARVMLVRRRGSDAGWDGKAFLNSKKEIAVAQGTQIMITTVANAGGKPDDGGRTDEQNLKKLLLGRVDLMAAYEEDLKILIEKKFRGRVEVLPVPLVETHYYLAFSKSFYAQNRELVQKIWNRIGKLKGHRKASENESS